MTRTVCLLALISSFSGFGQAFRVDTLAENDTWGNSSRFPVLTSMQNPKAAEKINYMLQGILLQNVYGSEGSIFRHVFAKEDEIGGLSDFTFEVTRNDDRFFAVILSYAATAAYSEYNTQAFNFCSKTGVLLTLDDLILPESQAELGSRINELAAGDINDLLNNLSDADEFATDKREMYSECVENYKGSQHLNKSGFLIKEKEILFLKERCSAHYNAALDELWNLNQMIAIDELKGYFTQYANEAFLGSGKTTGHLSKSSNRVLSGNIGGKYPIKIILNEDEYGVHGVYWYESQKRIIELRGTKLKDGSYSLTESVDGKDIARLNLKSSEHVQGLKGTWTKLAGGTSLPFEAK